VRAVRVIVCAAVAVAAVAAFNAYVSPPPIVLYIVAGVVGIIASMIAYGGRK
jgi:hypothetical protein